MTASSQPGDTRIAKEMIDHLALLSKAMDEYFEIPSMTVPGTGRPLREAEERSARPELPPKI